MQWLELFDAGGTLGHELEIALRFAAAALCGATIGYERERQARAAGLRTHMPTALAATVFTAITFEIFRAVQSMDRSPTTDPLRIIEAVTAGVAFLAAGSIIQSRGKVEGLTTGAGMWMAGALGVATGAGFYALALIAAAMSLAILALLRGLERRLRGAAEADGGDRRR